MGILAFLFGPRYKGDGSHPAELAIINARVVTSDTENPRAKAVHKKLHIFSV